MKDAARDVAFGEDRRFIRQLHLFELTRQFQVTRAMRFRHALKLAHHQRRNDRAVSGQLVLPPTNRQVTAKRLAVIKVSTDNGRFKIKALLHKLPATTSPGCVACSIDDAVAIRGSSRRTDFLKSKVTRK